MNDDLIIRAKGLTKVYKLKAKPGERGASFFQRRHSASETRVHYAVNSIDLDVKRGETLGIVGRNGAGKSTLLKLITQVIDPTSGSLCVKGKIHALLQLGTGFHADMTGRQNVLAYLAHLGLAGETAEKITVDVIDFAEVGEYIDQPLKSYSTGMQARLMFAAATSAKPDLLVIDEVLGVGDAYFQHKSFERIKEMSESDGTTVLIVSHDIYQVAKVCHRMVWMEDGHIKVHGKPIDVMKVYEASIAEQEECRLRKKLINSLNSERGDGGFNTQLVGVTQGTWFVEILCPDNTPPPANIDFLNAELQQNGTTICIASVENQKNEGLSICEELGQWGAVNKAEIGVSRVFENYGSAFHKAVFQVNWSALPKNISQNSELELVLEMRTAIQVDLIVGLSENGMEPYLLHRFALASGSSSRVQFSLFPADRLSLSQLRSQSALPHAGKRHGNGKISVTGLQFLDQDGVATMYLRHGHPLTIKIGYAVNDPEMKEKAQVLIAFHRSGVDDVMRAITRALEFDAKEKPNGVIDIRFRRFPLGIGDYTFTVMIAAEGYYDKDQTLFYTINPDVYEMWPKMAEIKVRGSSLVEQGTAVVVEADWSFSD